MTSIIRDYSGHSQNQNKNSISISVSRYENKEKYPFYVSKKCCEDKHVDMLLINEGEKKHYVLIKGFNSFMHDHTSFEEEIKFPTAHGKLQIVCQPFH